MKEPYRLSILVCVTLFLVFSTIAILTYHAGNAYFPHDTTFRFTQNFLSDLGIRSGYDNQSVSLVTNFSFALSLFAAAGGVLLFFRQQGSNQHTRVRFMAFLSAGALILIPFIPEDRFVWPHRILVLLVVLGFVGAGMSLSLATRKQTYWPYFILRVYSLLATAYLLWILFGPLPSAGLWPHMVHALAQKYVVYGFMITALAFQVLLPKSKSLAKQ